MQIADVSTSHVSTKINNSSVYMPSEIRMSENVVIFTKKMKNYIKSNDV